MENEEKTFEVQKNYSEEVITEIQHAINSKTATIKILASIDELPKNIYIDNVKITLSQLNEKYDAYLYLDKLMNNELIKKWHTCSTYAFYYKDWKKLNKNIDIFANDNYIEVNFNVKAAEIVVLLRRVDLELADNTFALMEYGEIFYNNAQYTIVKAFSPTIGESYSSKSMLENENYIEKIYDNYGSEIILSADGKYNITTNNEDDDNDVVSIDDIADPESEELF